MGEELPRQFDLVVIGTGFTESCVAAAASRIGKSVLHIDDNEYYGGSWASFNLESFTELIEKCTNKELQNCSHSWHEPSSQPEESSEQVMNKMQWTREKLFEKTRRFNLDLCPKVLYCGGELVQLLVKSNICRYAEFRAVDFVCTQNQDKIIKVPCSRSDVFNSKDINIVEKRLLMKFLNTCLTFGEEKSDNDFIEFRGKTFQEYLKAQRVTPKIETCVMQAIAMCNAETSFEDGMEKTLRFLKSLGRYGNTPFLFPMFGCGDIPQCFCRLCAVFGGIYCLSWPVTSMEIDATTNEVNLNVSGRNIKAKNVVCTHSSIPADFPAPQVHGYDNSVRAELSRGIFIGTSPLGDKSLNTGGGGVNLLRLTEPTEQREAILIQLSHYSGTCPEGTYVYHLTTPALSNNPSQDLSPFIAQVFSDMSPELLYSAYFTITSRSSSEALNGNSPIYCTAAPYYELDYDKSIKNAKDIFTHMYPSMEFLPRAPDPEEIVNDGEDPSALSEHNLPEDLREQLYELKELTENMDIEETPQQTEEQQKMEDDVEN